VVTPSSGNSSSSSEVDETPAEPLRADVELVCRHLVKRMVGNGHKRPPITKGWRESARLLIDRDHRSVENIIKAIDWAHDSDFWKPNIKSMPKLRAQYDTLRLQAQAQAKAKKAAEERQTQRPAAPPSNAPRPVARDEACPKHPYERASSCGACASERLAARKGA
jgi:hypothetical protein